MYGIVGATDSEVDAAILKKYGKNPDELSYVKQVAVIAGEYSRSLPKGFNQDKKNRRTYRRNAKREILAKAKEQIKPVGFVGFFFWIFISSIISWFIQRMLTHYFDDSSKGMFYEELNAPMDWEDTDSGIM